MKIMDSEYLTRICKGDSRENQFHETAGNLLETESASFERCCTHFMKNLGRLVLGCIENEFAI